VLLNLEPFGLRRERLMPRWVAPPSLELQLWYGDVLVADLHQVFPHQGTWFAPYELKIAPGDGALQDRLLEYIAFTDDFNCRIAQGKYHDFAEFDDFGAIADAGSWKVPRPDGGVIPMADRMWLVDGQASWQQPETAPSTEGAANELWERIAEYVAATDLGRQAREAEQNAEPFATATGQ
jgi:hypothetical protein